jgi:hypothetical protein
MFICCFPRAKEFEDAAAVELEATGLGIWLESARIFF